MNTLIRKATIVFIVIIFAASSVYAQPITVREYEEEPRPEISAEKVKVEEAVVDFGVCVGSCCRVGGGSENYAFQGIDELTVFYFCAFTPGVRVDKFDCCVAVPEGHICDSSFE